MKYYVVIGHKKGEIIDGQYDGRTYDCDWIEMIERDEPYSEFDYPPGAHQFFGYLDINFNESVQYGHRATKTQEAWLIGRHRIARVLDFGNFGYQFVRERSTKRIQFPEKITISFSKAIKDNNVNKPATDIQRVDIELTELNSQLINCYDKECTIDPIVFKLTKFDNYGDAYIDLEEINNLQDFKLHIEHFVHFMKNYPSSNIFLVCKNSQQEIDIKNLLRNVIVSEHLTNYFEFCNSNFERRAPGYSGGKSGTPNSEYDTFKETIEQFFDEHTFNSNHNSVRNFYNIPFKKAKITINNNWDVYANSAKFIAFLQNNPAITLEIAGTIETQDVIQFIQTNLIKAHLVLEKSPINREIESAIARNRQVDLQKAIVQHGLDKPEVIAEDDEENEEFRLSLEKYLPQKLNLANVQNVNVDIHVGQNQNQNQNQNQAQQIRQSQNTPYEPTKLEINNKTSIPDVNFATQDKLLKSLIGLPFQNGGNAPQTEGNIDHLFAVMEQIIEKSPASKDCYCPLSYSVEELVPGAFYVPKERVSTIPHPSYGYVFDRYKNTLFFSPPYASIAIKKDKYAFKPFNRPNDTGAVSVFSGFAPALYMNEYCDELSEDYTQATEKNKFNLLINRLYEKRGRAGVNLLTRALFSLKSKNPEIYQSLSKNYLLTSNDFSEYVDNPGYLASFDALAKLKDKKKIDWWNKLLEIQCRSNPNFDINHLFMQFSSFWGDMDKVQKFIPIPEQFPFNDFADAGITLGKMYRIMIRARNRFEQIKSFEGGNISHAYMLFDLFNSSMYSKEMDSYCITLTQQLKAEDAFDKSKLKETYFSTQKLAELSEDSSVTLEKLKSYLLIYAAVNGNTKKHNHSDLSLYKAVFKTFDECVRDQYYSEAQQKVLLSAIMLLAAYGNNTTKDCLLRDINTLVNKPNPLQYCHDIIDIYRDKKVSDYFSAQEVDGKMAHSEAMPSFHTVVTLTQNSVNYKNILKQATGFILLNDSLSPAVQKIMLDAPYCYRLLEDSPYYLEKKRSDRDNLIQSLFLMTVALNPKQTGTYSVHDFFQFQYSVDSLTDSQMKQLNQLFLDINFATLPQKNLMFRGASLASEFIAKVSRSQGFDDIFFILQDYQVKLNTIKASEKGLVERIKLLEYNLDSDAHKKHYVTNYQELIEKRFRAALGDAEHKELSDRFITQIVKKIDESYLPQELKMCFEALNQLIETSKKEELLLIVSLLEQFNIGKTLNSITPVQLLKVTSLLMKHIYPVETIATFLKTLNADKPKNANAKLHFMQVIFEKLNNEARCFENNDVKRKLTRELVSHIKASMELMNVIDSVDAPLVDVVIEEIGSLAKVSTTQYLEFISVLAAPTNLRNAFLKAEFNGVNYEFFSLLGVYPDCFSDLVDIAQFDAELLNNISFKSRAELNLVAKICKNEVYLNSRKTDEPQKNYKKQCYQDIKTLLAKGIDLKQFYSQEQLAQPSAEVLVQLLAHYQDKVDKALHHFEKDPWFKRPHKKSDIFGNNQEDDKELAYQVGFFDMSKQNKVLDQITSKDKGFEKSVRRNLLFTCSNYINEIGFRLPAFKHTEANGGELKVPARKLSDKELKVEFLKVKEELASLRASGQDNIWQNKKYQRAVCKLLALIREASDREGNKNAYSTQMDAIILALLAGDYQYAMQINTGEGKILIAAAIDVALQTITDKQIVVTTSNLSLAERDSELYDRLIQWFGISHATIAATTKDKSKLQAKIIHTTGNDFALCHGKDILINNANRIYLNDESDYTLSHLTPSINSQTKPNEEESWWVYEEILAYVTKMDTKEASKKPELQVRGLIKLLIKQYTDKIVEIEKELTKKLHEVDQAGLTEEAQLRAKEAIEKDCNGRMNFYAKRIASLNHEQAEEHFNILIDSAIIAQFVLKKGEGYEVIDCFDDGKLYKKVVPTEGGKPITEGDVLYMYGIHQFLIQKTILEFQEEGDDSEFLRPSELESTTYYNNYSIQAGAKAIGITGTVPKQKYRMYEALISGGKTDVIPPHNASQRVDAVPYDRFIDIKIGNEHVCKTEDNLISKLVRAIQYHDGPTLIYCPNKNSCEARRDALIKQLGPLGFTVQMIIPGVTEGFTDGDRLTPLGRQAQNKNTVTITVGDGRGIDITPKGEDGLLTIPAFAPETPEKLLQIYGRSGRNGQPGKTNLYLLEGELTKYGVTFENLDEQYTFLDEIRHKEFDFAIKKIGFMQYQVQNRIRDEHKKTEILSYMDDLYNKLVLRAVADKVKNKQENRVQGRKVSGRWEPFVMLNDEDLKQIYEEFCTAVDEKLQEMHIYIDSIKNLQSDHQIQASEAIEKEQSEQKGLDKASIRIKLANSANKQEVKLWSTGDTDKLADGMEFDLTDKTVKKIYQEFTLNIGRFEKTISLMQKYVGTHLGIYGFINDSTFVPYKEIYALLEQQKQIICRYQKEETDKFYRYSVFKESLAAIQLVLSDINYGSKENLEAVDRHFNNAERYNNMSMLALTLGDDSIAELRFKVMDYYKKDAFFSQWEINELRELQYSLERNCTQLEGQLGRQQETVIGQCLEVYQGLQERIFEEGAYPLELLTQSPLSDQDLKLANLFSMLQMVSSEERDSAPVQQVLKEIAKEEDPKIAEYNKEVERYKKILKLQRECLDFLHKEHKIRAKVSKYEEMIRFENVSSKNMVRFYHEYNSASERLETIKADIKNEQLILNQLENEVEDVKQAEDAERKRLAKEKADQEERDRRILYFNKVQSKVSNALSALEHLMGQIDHPLIEAKTVARTLLGSLKKGQSSFLHMLQIALLEEIDLADKEYKNHPSIRAINTTYIQGCAQLINDLDTRRVLERDLNWGSFLTNLLKIIANAVLYVLTFGTTSGFFTLEKSRAITIVDEAKDELSPILKMGA